MAIMKAVPCIGADIKFRFVEYNFKPVPVTDGAALDADIDLLLSLTARTYLVPFFPLWIFMGLEGEGLFLRRAATRELREAFEAEFARRHPLLVARTEVARARLSAVTVIKGARATMPELIFSEAIHAVIPVGVRHLAQVPLPLPGTKPSGNSLRCDHQLRFDNARPGPVTWIEILGMLDLARRPITQRGVEYAASRNGRESVYAAAGLPNPVELTAGTLCDPVARSAAIAGILAPFRG